MEIIVICSEIDDTVYLYKGENGNYEEFQRIIGGNKQLEYISLSKNKNMLLVTYEEKTELYVLGFDGKYSKVGEDSSVALGRSNFIEE